MNYILAFCDKSYIVQIMVLVKLFFKLICYIAPPIVIIVSIISFVKPVTTGDEKDLKESRGLLIRRIIAGIIIFLLPTLISYVFNNFTNGNNVDFLSCMESATQEKVEKLKAKEEQEEEAARKAQEKEDEKILEETEKAEQKKRDQNKKIFEETKKSYTKHLNYIYQGNYPNLPFCSGDANVANSGCGAASFSMIASSYSDPSYGIENVSSWFCQNHYSETIGGLNMSAMLAGDTLNHFGLQGKTLFYAPGTSTYNDSQGQAILNSVKEGNSVIINVPGHWLVAGPNEECTSNQVYLYDPSGPSKNGCYTPRELFNATYNHRNRCTNEGLCGWKVASVFGKKVN